jgi:hypothetical protein
MKIAEILNKVFDDKRYMIALVVLWFIICAVGFSTVGLFSSEFMKFGPNDTLTYLTIKIDTWSRYIFILLFTVISTCVNDLASDSLGPFFTNAITDHKSRHLPYRKNTILMISQIWSLYCNFMGIASVALVFSQFDLILVRAFVDLAVNFFTMNRFMRNKEYDPNAFGRYFEQESCVEEELSESNNLPTNTT